MSLLYLRHGEKLYANGAMFKEDNNLVYINYAHDSPLSQNGISSITKMIPTYLERYGVPDRIYCSPYLRTRQTAKLIQNYLSTEMMIMVDIYCNNDLSEYLGNQVIKMKKSGQHNLKILRYPETNYHNPPVEDSFSKFQQRVHSHYSTIDDLLSKDKKIWMITHGLVITEISKLISTSIGKIDSFKGIKIIKRDDKYEIDMV